MTNDARVVAKLRLPYNLHAYPALEQAMRGLYGEGLTLLTTHPDAREWLVWARPANADERAEKNAA